MNSFQVGTALSIAYDENGMLGVQVDAHGENAAGHGRYAVGCFGLIGRPLAANTNGGALTLYADEGREGFAWLGFDHRDLGKLPALTDGSVCLYNSGAEHLLLDAATGEATLKATKAILDAAVEAKSTLTVATSAAVGGPGAGPAALGDPLVSYLDALEGLLSALATAVDAKLPPSPGASLGAVQTFSGASAALKAAMKSRTLTAV